jgi:hypothetical protein
LVVVLVVVHIEDIHQVLRVEMVVQVEVLAVITITPEHFSEVQEFLVKDLEVETQPRLTTQVVVVGQMLKVPIQPQLLTVVQEGYQPF